MVSLLAHGVHLLLVVLGLIGVAALLLPPFDLSPLSRRTAFRPPTTQAEHQARVAQLRSAISSGHLTAPPATASSTSTDDTSLPLGGLHPRTWAWLPLPTPVLVLRSPTVAHE
jgi:hypothetical protein